MRFAVGILIGYFAGTRRRGQAPVSSADDPAPATATARRAPVGQFTVICALLMTSLALTGFFDGCADLLAAVIIVNAPVTALGTITWAATRRPWRPVKLWILMSVGCALVNFAMLLVLSSILRAAFGHTSPISVAFAFYESAQILTTVTAELAPASWADRWIFFWEMGTTVGMISYALQKIVSIEQRERE